MSNETQNPFDAAVAEQLAQKQTAPTATDEQATPDQEPEEGEREFGPETEEEAAPEYDYSGKIKLSAADYDVIDAEEAKELVKSADINQGYKTQILEQIEGGSLTYQFAEAVRRMKSAKASGGIYRGGQDGL